MSIQPTAAPDVATAADGASAKPTIDKAQVAKLAAEFESLLLSNILKDMRAAGRWADEESNDTLGAGAFNQTFDAELSRTLAQAGGFGLSGFLQKALERYAPDAASATAAMPTALAAPLTPAATEAITPHTAFLASPAGLTVKPLNTSAPAGTPAVGRDLTDELTRPTAKTTSAFGWRHDPLTGVSKFHKGVDLKAAEGDPVNATGTGRVVFSGRNGGYGNSVVIEHANGLQTRYAHLSASLVSVGDQVSEGQPIGRAGHTGRATGPHVHYEVLDQGRAVDPLR